VTSYAPPDSAFPFFLMKIRVLVMPKSSVLDPQGVAVRNALTQHGLDSVRETRVGRIIELELDVTDRTAAEAALHPVCRDLLSNPVIEDYSIEFPAAQ